MQRADGLNVTYDPKRLQGISAYRETSREFAQGDRVQFTGINRDLGVSNRDLGTITKIEGTQLSVKMDGDKPREITFDSAQMRHLDHGYAVTSHSSQGLTTGRVLVNMDTTTHAELINTRFAYVSVSRASQDARIYTNDAAQLGERLATNVSKSSAVAVEPTPTNTQEKVMEPPTREPKSIGTRHPFNLPFQKKPRSSTGKRSSRTVRRATSTGKRKAGSTSIRKASATTRTAATYLRCSPSKKPPSPSTISNKSVPRTSGRA